MNAGPPKFQQPPSAGLEPGQIKLGFRIIAPGRHKPLRRQQTVDTHHIRQRIRVSPGVDQQKVIEERVKLVHLKPVFVVNHRALRAQFLDKDRIAQPLGRAQIAGVFGQSQGQGGVNRHLGRHFGL